MVARGREQEERARIRTARLAEAAEIAARTRVLEESVVAFGARYEALRERLADLRFTAEIDPGLGAVTIDGTGTVIDVRFESRAVEMADPSRLGLRVLKAWEEARTKAFAARREALMRKGHR